MIIYDPETKTITMKFSDLANFGFGISALEECLANDGVYVGVEDVEKIVVNMTAQMPQVNNEAV
jgi:hypothetical protein